MARRESNGDLAIDLGIARSTDFDRPPVSSRVAPKWRAPRPVTWPPPLPAHRIPGSVPRSAPPNRFHEPVLHAPILASYIAPRKSRSGAWLALFLLVAAGAGGFALREQVATGANTASAWVMGHVPSDLSQRPRIAWARIEDFATRSVTRLRSLVPGQSVSQPPSAAPVVADPTSTNIATPPNPSESTHPAKAEAPSIDVSALPVAPARPVFHTRPAAPRDVSTPVAAQDPAPAPVAATPPPVRAARVAQPAAEPAPVREAPPPVSTPAPEPGSLDDLIRKTVERESHQKH
jgi:hypothetical protein